MKKTAKETTPPPKPATKRKGVRFSPDPGTLAHVDLSVKGAFKPTLICLVTEESFKGCGLVALSPKGLEKGDECRVQLGEGPVLEAEVRWRTDLDAQTVRLGLLYID